METINFETKIREWYLEEYQEDTLGEQINENVTFEDLYNTLDRLDNVYELLGVGDSVIRERVFEELAKIMEVDYDYVYQQWLLCK